MSVLESRRLSVPFFFCDEGGWQDSGALLGVSSSASALRAALGPRLRDRLGLTGVKDYPLSPLLCFY